VVKAIFGGRPVRRRLLELGLVPGTQVRVVGVSPLGDPLELEVRGSRLSIRKKEALTIEVET
jgi:ferrous iron transport protein A